MQRDDEKGSVFSLVMNPCAAAFALLLFLMCFGAVSVIVNLLIVQVANAL